MRVFIVGNGPSLGRTDLELLKGEYSWGVNQIHMIYPQTSWRPTHVTFAEMTAGGEYWFPKIWEAVRQNPQAKKFARDDAWWWTDEMERHDVTRFNACTHHDILDEGPPENRYDKVPDVWHFPQVCKFGGSVPMTIQLAVLEDIFDEIFLIGCDLGYKTGKDNHFHPDYAPGKRGIVEGKAIKRNEVTAMAHEYALRNSPIPIYNATLGGELETYPRINYDTLFCNR